MSSKRKQRIVVYGLVSRYGPQSVASANGMTCHVRREYFVPKLQYFLGILGIFITQTKQIISSLLLNNFYSVIYRRVREESNELLYTVWSLVMVRNQLPAQVVNLLC